MKIATAFLLRDVRLQRSYRLQFGVQLLSVLLSLTTYAFLAHLVPSRQRALQAYDTDYFTFVLIGTGAATFFTVGLGSFSESLGREQTSGTLEALLVTPNHARTLLLGGAVWPVLFAATNLVIYLVIGVIIFGGRLAPGNLLLAVVTLALSLAAFSSLGLVAAATLIQVKRASVVVVMTGAMFSLLGGVLYPVSVLPAPVQAVAHLLPVTYGLEGLRQSLAVAPNLGVIGRDCVALIAFTLVLAPAAVGLINWSLRQARREGSLAHY